MAEESNLLAWVKQIHRLLLGGTFLWAIDKLLSYLYPRFLKKEAGEFSIISLFLMEAVSQQNKPYLRLRRIIKFDLMPKNQVYVN